jgi:hypothetical protein
MFWDMTLFVDEDESAYHITASEENQTLLISKYRMITYR